MTVRFLPSNRTRLPCALGVSRPAPTTTPALVSSSLNFWYAAIASGVGGAAASLCWPSFANISTRISVSSLGLHRYIEWQEAVSTWVPEILRPLTITVDRDRLALANAPVKRGLQPLLWDPQQAAGR